MINRFAILLLVGFSLQLSLVPCLVNAQEEYSVYLNVTNVVGGSSNTNFPGWSDASDFSFSVERNYTMNLGSPVAGALQLSLFRIVKSVDRSSPSLARKCSQGTMIQRVRVDVWSKGPVPRVVSRFILKDVLIDNIQPGANGLSNAPTEEVFFDYEAISWTFYGSGPGSTVVGCWNQVLQTPTCP